MIHQLLVLLVALLALTQAAKIKKQEFIQTNTLFSTDGVTARWTATLMNPTLDQTLGSMVGVCVMADAGVTEQCSATLLVGSGDLQLAGAYVQDTEHHWAITGGTNFWQDKMGQTTNDKTEINGVSYRRITAYYFK